MHEVDEYCSMFSTRLPYVLSCTMVIVEAKYFLYIPATKRIKNINNWNGGKLLFEKWH